MNNKGIIYLIPTPIGNIKDITLRSIDVLKEVDEIYCEDTRETKKLLEFYDIRKTLFVNNDINEKENIEKIIDKLLLGKNIALLSDRGTPIISDPGFKIIRACVENDIKIESLPGATAFVPALTLSGFSPKPFYYYGFLNSKQSKRKSELEEIKNIESTLIFYESVHRLYKTLEDILLVLGDRNIIVARELTKQHEEIIRGKVSEVLKNNITLKGEFVIVVENSKIEKQINDEQIVKMIKLNIKNGLSEKEAISLVALQNKLSKSKTYNLYQNMKKGE